jgi:cyanate lyase
MALPPHATARLDAQRRSNLSFADLGARLGQDEVWTASLPYRKW